MSGRIPHNDHLLETKDCGRRCFCRRILSLFVCVCLIFTLVSCKKEIPKESISLFALDTYVTITVEGKEAKAAVQDASVRLTQWELLLSRQIVGSEIDRLNASSAEEPVELSSNTYALLARTAEYAAKTGGVFDPTIAPLMDLWGFGSEQAHVPDAAEIAETLPRIGYEKLHLLPDQMAYVEPGCEVDLGGVAKGWIGDQLMKGMQRFDVSKIILDLGGNICVWSKKGELNVGIKAPDDSQNLCAIVTLPADRTPTSVITSGAYERYFEQDGVRYGHIMDTTTGCPVQTDLLSATVIGNDGGVGDILSTTLYAMGLEAARTWAEEEGIDCILCAENGTLWISSSMKGYVDAEDGWTIEYFG